MAWNHVRSACVSAAVYLGLLVGIAVGHESIADSGVQTVSTEQLVPVFGGGITLIDIRRADEWRATGVIAGSHLITAFDAEGRLRPTFLAEVAAVSAPDRPVALLCRSGNRSAAAARLLTAQSGFRTVYSVAGGMNDWLREGRPVDDCRSC
ncbi:MAG: rhodanese-like domain-containing protein [Defluviicoccus sp.]